MVWLKIPQSLLQPVSPSHRPQRKKPQSLTQPQQAQTPTGDRKAKKYSVLLQRGIHRAVAAACTHFHLATQHLLPYLQHGFSLKTDIRHSGSIRNFRWTAMLQINKLPHASLRPSRLHSPAHRQTLQQAVWAQWLEAAARSSYFPHSIAWRNEISETFISVVHLLSSPTTGFVPISHKPGSQTEVWRLLKMWATQCRYGGRGSWKRPWALPTLAHPGSPPPELPRQEAAQAIIAVK